jgi:prepilin-type N-terminal cleavage/methylation domain-containing protein
MQKSSGFTLIELLAVTGIILLMTAIAIPNFRLNSKQLALQRSAVKLAQDLRRAQELAISSQEVSGVVPYGFGIHFDNSLTDRYVLFADLNNDHHRDAADQDLETIKLEPDITISDLAPAFAFSVLFVPPDPAVFIHDLSSGTQASITLNSSQTIFVNNAGLIAIQ